MRSTALLLGVLLFPLGQEAPVPAPAADGAGPVTGVHPPVERSDPTRAARLAQQRQDLESLLARMEQFGHQDEWIADCTRRYEAWDALHPDEPGHVEIGEWTITTALLRAISLVPRAPALERRSPKDDGTYTLLVTLVDLERQFAARGIDFLVVAVPSKLSVYPEIVLPELKGVGFAGMGLCVVKQFLESSREGVETQNLSEPFVAARVPEDPSREDLLFLKSDPHWTVRGAELCAEHVAQRIAEYPWFKRGPYKENSHFRVEERSITYNAGDELASKGSRDELMRGRVVVQGNQPFPSLDPRSPILVFGDSYARVHNEQGADFCSQLTRFTGWKIDCVFAASGGQQQVRQKLARREPADWTGKRLAIWLLPEQLAIARLRYEPIELFAEEEE